MPPKQATLGKFFGNPSGSKAPSKQSKLAFSSKAAPPATNDEDVEMEEAKPQPEVDSKDEGDVKMENGAADTEVKPKVKKEEDAEVKPKVKKEVKEKVKKEEKENVKPNDKKKRSRTDEKKVGVKTEKKSKVKKEEVEEEEDEDDEPLVKRPRRAPKTVVEDEEEVSSPPKEALARRGSTQSAAASEGDEAAEEDEDDEDEKPEVAAKAREKVQTTLKSKAKDPYPDWKAGDPVPYAALCTTFSLVEMTSKRLIIQSHCSLFLRQVLRLTPDDLLPTVLLMINKLAADYAGIELGIGESLIMKAIGESTGRSLAVIKQDQKEIGDLGLVAVKSRANQPTMFKPKPLTVRGVHKGLMDVATTSGNGAQQRKVDLIKKLLSAADGHTSGKVDITKDKGGPSEAKFIIRFLEGKLRLGLAERTVIVSLAQAMVCHDVESKGAGKVPSTEQLAEGESILKDVYSEAPSYDVIIPAMLKHGIFNLKEHCKLQPGVPLKPMLAKPTKAITEVLDRFENQTFTCEYKYDGERSEEHTP